MRTLASVLLAACALFPAQAAEHAALDARLQAEHAGGRFDGVVLVGRDDAIAYEQAFGLADRANETPHATGATWRWASVSKQVTAVLAMQLVQSGALSLDDTVATRLPGFAAPDAGRITLRQLLQHTSGLPNPDDSPAGPDGVPAFYAKRFQAGDTPVASALRYCAGTPKAAPGATFSYDNCDTLVLQAVLERATGKPYATLVSERIAKPLALRSVGVFPDDPARAPSTVAGYVDGAPEPVQNLATYGAGGALYGKARDLWRFDRALIDGTLLDAAATKTLWTGDPKLGYVALGAWSFEAPLRGCTGNIALVERRGQIGGVQVRNLIAPALRSALVVFSNTTATDFGELWQGQGLGYDLASAAFCPASPVAVSDG